MSIKKLLNYSFIVIITCTALFSIRGAVGSAYADSFAITEDKSATIVATPDPEDPEEGDNPEEEEDVEGTVTIIRERKEILFPYERLQDGIQGALADTITSASDDTASELIPTISEIEDIVLNNQDSIFAETRSSIWRVTIVIAGILMPLTLVVSVGAALKDGASSVTGYAGAREALVNWFVGVGAALGSYFLLNKAIELAIGAEHAVIDGVARAVNENWDIGAQLVGNLLNTGTIRLLPLPVQIFLGIFVFLLLVALVASIALAWLAREVLLLLLVGIAPLILVGGTIGPLRWLSGTWTKVTIVTLLLGPANYLLIGAASLTTTKANEAGLLEGHFIGMLIALGVISVLLGLNGFAGKIVYGAVIEIAQKAWKTTMAIGQLAATAAGFVAAPAIGGALGGAAGAVGVGSGGLGPMAGGGAGALSTYGQVMSQAGVTRAIGQALSATGNPIARGFGAGLNIGAAKEARDQLSARLGGTGVPKVEGTFDKGNAIQDAQDDIIGKYAPGASGVSSGQSPVTDDDFLNSVKAGGELVDNTFSAMDNLGIDKNNALAELGYYQPGDNLQASATYFARANAGTYALGVHSSTPVPDKSQVSSRYLNTVSPNRITAHDVHGALDILVNKGVRGFGGGAPDPELITNMSRAVYHRRTQFGQDFRSIINSAQQSEGASGLHSWMSETYSDLKNKGSASDLARYLGIGNS